MVPDSTYAQHPVLFCSWFHDIVCGVYCMGVEQVTTLAANLKEIAADSRTSWDNEFCTTGDKIEIIGRSVVATGGETSSIFRFVRWLKDPTQERPTELDFTAIMLNEKGLWLFADSCDPMPIKDPFITAGTGGMAAKAAMLCGKSPKRAVEIAIMCDNNSGLPVQRITLAQALRSKVS